MAHELTEQHILGNLRDSYQDILNLKAKVSKAGGRMGPLMLRAERSLLGVLQAEAVLGNNTTTPTGPEGDKRGIGSVTSKATKAALADAKKKDKKNQERPQAKQSATGVKVGEVVSKAQGGPAPDRKEAKKSDDAIIRELEGMTPEEMEGAKTKPELVGIASYINEAEGEDVVAVKGNKLKIATSIHEFLTKDSEEEEESEE